MLEIAPARLAVIGCYARPHALDELAVDRQRLRVAPDELLLLAPIADAGNCLGQAQRALAAADPGGLTLDVSDAFSGWTLRGDGREEAFRRLCAVALPDPPAVLQGLFAHVPAKVLVGPDELVVLASSTLGHHVHERVMAACVDLAPRERSLVPVRPETAEAALPGAAAP